MSPWIGTVIGWIPTVRNLSSLLPLVAGGGAQHSPSPKCNENMLLVVNLSFCGIECPKFCFVVKSYILGLEKWDCNGVHLDDRL